MGRVAQFAEGGQMIRNARPTTLVLRDGAVAGITGVGKRESSESLR